MVVARYLSRYLVTYSAVNPGRNLLIPFLIALNHVEGMGMNASVCKNPMISDMVLVSYAPLVVGVHGLLHWCYIGDRRLRTHKPVIMLRHPVKIVFS